MLSSQDPACSYATQIIGLGYIGLPTAALLASQGERVHGVDVRPEVVAAVNAGAPHIEEPGLPELLAAAVRAGRLQAGLAPQPAQVHIIAVPTPCRAEDHQPDTSMVLAAAASLAPVLADDNLVILESTSPVGTTRKLASLFAELRPELTGLKVAYCPERVLPCQILHELVHNDRAAGGVDPAAAAAAAAYYRRFVQGTVVETRAEVAEMTKLAENAYRDVNIAFAHELDTVCRQLGIDTRAVIALANRHPRVNILAPSAGVGGHCIAVDPWFIVAAAPGSTPLMRTAREINDRRPLAIAEEIIRRAKAGRVALLGLTYKPDVDDIRESPALQIARLVGAARPDTVICEPHLQELPPGTPGRLVPLAEALNCDLVACLVAHREFAGQLAGLKPAQLVDPCGAGRTEAANQ